MSSLGMVPTADAQAHGTGEDGLVQIQSDDEHETPTSQLETAQMQWKTPLLSGKAGSPVIPTTRAAILTSANLKSNQPWGDRMGPKAPSVTRLYSINVNGIKFDRRGGTYL